MNHFLSIIKTNIYKPCGFKVTDVIIEKEGKEYDACQFQLNGLKVISRSSKITPKKVGQFVTFWKRTPQGPIAPYNIHDDFDFYIINVMADDKLGQFVFPKSILSKKGILSSEIREGKRGFRVYPVWDVPTSTQAVRTQKWQLEYFFEMNTKLNFEIVKTLYKKT